MTNNTQWKQTHAYRAVRRLTISLYKGLVALAFTLAGAWFFASAIVEKGVVR
jgi:hypothetical protein